MHWDWLTVIYLFSGGLGAGAYFTSFAAEQGWLGAGSRLARIGYYIGAPIVACSALLLVWDLGQGFRKPWLLINIFSNPNSVMTWGVWILSAFMIVGLIKGFLTFKRISAPAALTWAGAILALATAGYTGLLVAVVNAVPFWNDGIILLLFLVSALSTGLSAVALLASFTVRTKANPAGESRAHILLIAVELILVVIFLSLTLTGVKGPAGTESAKLLVSGGYKLVFWGYFMGLGLLFPLVIFSLQNHRFRRQRKVRLTKHGSFLSRVADFMVLIGGLSLRFLVVFAAIPVWNGFTLP